jgi:putative hydrolase of the HAD superfamily
LVLSDLAERGYRLAVASNFDRRLRAIVQADPVLRRCERSFISSEIGWPKPDPRFFAAAAAQLDLPPGEIMLVGDDWTNDILGARAASWQAVWLDRKAAGKHGSGIHRLTELLTLYRTERKRRNSRFPRCFGLV